LNIAHGHFKKKLEKKGFRLVGEFNCLGYDTYSLLKAVGGINKNRPDSKDMDKAERFARTLPGK
ncbi:MAG: flavodoxin, partial [Patescibacteria group bacterium]